MVNEGWKGSTWPAGCNPVRRKHVSFLRAAKVKYTQTTASVDGNDDCAGGAEQASSVPTVSTEPASLLRSDRERGSRGHRDGYAGLAHRIADFDHHGTALPDSPPAESLRLICSIPATSPVCRMPPIAPAPGTPPIVTLTGATAVRKRKGRRRLRPRLAGRRLPFAGSVQSDGAARRRRRGAEFAVRPSELNAAACPPPLPFTVKRPEPPRRCSPSPARKFFPDKSP